MWIAHIYEASGGQRGREQAFPAHPGRNKKMLSFEVIPGWVGRVTISMFEKLSLFAPMVICVMQTGANELTLIKTLPVECASSNLLIEASLHILFVHWTEVW
jgi:hypothetical protein